MMKLKTKELGLSERQRKLAVECGIRDCLKLLSPLFGILESIRFPNAMADDLNAALKQCRDNASTHAYKYPEIHCTVRGLEGIRRISTDLKKMMFVRALISNGFNIRSAAISCGYSEKKAKDTGAALLRDEVIQNLIGQVISDERNKAVADIEEMLQTATTILRGGGDDKTKLDAIRTMGKFLGAGKSSVSVNIANGVKVNPSPMNEPQETIVRIIDNTMNETEFLKMMEEPDGTEN